MKGLGLLVAAMAVFAAVLWLTFPTDVAVRWALAHAPLPAGRALEFRAATLRPWGVRLDDVVVHEPDGVHATRLAWLRLRPSLLGLLGAHGFPWYLTAALCGGEATATVDDDGATRTLDARWRDVDVNGCLPLRLAPVPMRGAASGSAVLHATSDDVVTAGNVELVLRDAVWRPPLPNLRGWLLRADTADVALAIDPERIAIERCTARGPELDVSATGGARRGARLADARLDVLVGLTPQPSLPGAIREHVDALPQQADGSHAFRITGTVELPRVELP